MTPPSTGKMLASPAPPSVSVSVSFSAAHGRSVETEARSRSSNRPSMNAGARPCKRSHGAPPRWKACAATALSEPGLTVQEMAIRPSARWRARVDEEARELAVGTRAPSDAFLSELFPESLLAATDEALRA
jgi:hypothetical protein